MITLIDSKREKQERAFIILRRVLLDLDLKYRQICPEASQFWKERYGILASLEQEIKREQNIGD